MENNEKIKDIYNISFDLGNIPKRDRCQMHEWYNDVINKTYDELNLFDITRMIIQKEFLDLAVSKAKEYIEENPFCGQRYEGELLELLSKMDMPYLEKYKEKFEEILLKALVQNKTYNWLCEEERSEFQEIVADFLEKIKKS